MKKKKTQNKDSYIFILNLVDYFGPIPFEIIEDHYFDRASNSQIKEIKEINDDYVQSLNQPIPYEYKIIETRNGTNINQSYSELPFEKWRYWVIRFKGYNTEIHPIQIAMELLPQEILLSFMIVNMDFPGGMAYNARQIINYYMQSTIPRNSVSKIYKKDLLMVKKYYRCIKKAEKDKNSIWISLLRYHGLYTIPAESGMIIIGLFSVIEALITHRPKLTESLDSITHQIYSKVRLLYNRSKLDLDYQSYFGECKEETIWKKLYNYRSKIVHGDWVVFDGDLSILKSSQNVHNFLKNAVKMLLIQALLEPQLILDLKKC